MKLKLLTSLLGFLFLTCNIQSQSVSPFQTGAYSTAFMGVRDMAKGSPGLFVVWYNQYAFTNKYADKHGTVYSSTTIDNIDINIDINTFATVPALFYGMPFTVLGGAQWMVGVVPSYIWADATVGIHDRTGNLASQSSTSNLSGMGDLYVAPLGLSWGKEHYDLTVYYGFNAPTGRYEAGADDNIGLGFWTHQPQVFAYYYPNVDQSSAFLLGLTYEFSGDLKGADFNPGNRLSLEYGISQYLSDRLELGIIGGNNWQVTDDRGADVDYDTSVHDRKSTLAFTAGYWIWNGRMQLNAKYAFDYGSRQRFNTNFFMLNLTFVTNALTGSKL